MHVGLLISLIRDSANLTQDEKESIIEALQRAARRSQPRPGATRLRDLKPGLQSVSELVRFCRSEPGIRRWYVARLFRGTGEPAESMTFLDLYFAPAAKTLLKNLETHLGESFDTKKAEAFFLGLRKDNLEWWEEEDFELPAHLTLGDFRAFLIDFSGYPGDQPVEEGMVFIEISGPGRIRFVQFSLQAREVGKAVMSRLMSQPGSEGEADGRSEPR